MCIILRKDTHRAFDAGYYLMGYIYMGHKYDEAQYS